MTILVTIQAQLVVGEEQVIKSLAPEGMLAAVFEDDGRTGYFYALDESVEETRLWTQYTSTMPKTFQTVTFLLMLKLAGQKIVRSAYSDQWIPARGIRFRGKKRVLQEWLSSPYKQGVVSFRA